MPRVTRAALRSNAALEDSDFAASVPLPSTPHKKRAPLGEIAGNVCEDSRKGDTSSEVVNAKKKGSSRAKKGRTAKTTKVDDSANKEILEDNDQSTTSSAVEEACDDLMKGHLSGRLRP